MNNGNIFFEIEKQSKAFNFQDLEEYFEDLSGSNLSRVSVEEDNSLHLYYLEFYIPLDSYIEEECREMIAKEVLTNLYLHIATDDFKKEDIKLVKAYMIKLGVEGVLVKFRCDFVLKVVDKNDK